MTQLEAYIIGSSGIKPDTKKELLAMIKKENCSFHCFKPSGTWYASGEGFVDNSVFEEHGRDSLDRILELNEGCWPGLSTKGEGFFRIALPHEDLDYGYPQMYLPDV